VDRLRWVGKARNEPSSAFSGPRHRSGPLVFRMAFHESSFRSFRAAVKESGEYTIRAAGCTARCAAMAEACALYRRRRSAIYVERRLQPSRTLHTVERAGSESCAGGAPSVPEWYAQSGGALTSCVRESATSRSQSGLSNDCNETHSPGDGGVHDRVCGEGLPQPPTGL